MMEHVYFCMRAVLFLFTIYCNDYNAGFSNKVMYVGRTVLRTALMCNMATKTTERHTDMLKTNPMMVHIYFCTHAVLITIYYNNYNAGFSNKVMYVGRTVWL